MLAEVRGVFVVSNVLRLAGRSRLHSQLAWRSAARRVATARGSAAKTIVPEAIVRVGHAGAVSCRSGFQAVPRGGKLMPWRIAAPAPLRSKPREWSNGVLGMNLGMSAVEGTLMLQAIGAIVLAGVGVAVACLLVYMLGSKTFSEPAAPQRGQVYGMEAPVEQAQGVVGSYQVAGSVIGGWLASAGDAYRAAVREKHSTGGIFSLGQEQTGSRAWVASRN